MLEIFVKHLGLKRKTHKCNFHYVALLMMSSKILKFRYLQNETLFFLKIKNSLNTHEALLYDKK